MLYNMHAKRKIRAAYRIPSRSDSVRIRVNVSVCFINIFEDKKSHDDRKQTNVYVKNKVTCRSPDESAGRMRTHDVKRP